MQSSVSELSHRFVDDFEAVDPVEAVLGFSVGLHGSTLTDFSPAGFDAQVDLLRSTLAALAEAPIDGDVDRLGVGSLEDFATGRLGLIESGEYESTISAIRGPQSSVRSVFDLMPTDDDNHWELVADRLEAVPGSLASYVELLRVGLTNGRTAAGRQVESVIEQCRTWAGGGGGGWFSEFAHTYGDGALADRLARAGGAADTAYADLADWLEREYAPRSTDVDAVGEERYRVWAWAMLGVADLDLDEAYDWGWEELARLESEKAVECERILPGATYPEVVEFLSTHPGHVIQGVDAYRAWLQEITDAATHALNGVEFDIPDVLLRCDVSIPPEGSAAAAYYTAPPEDLSLPGRVWFPTMGRTTFPRWDQVTTACHEAVPGHHLQVGLTMLLPLTRLHRLSFNSAHGEGWALYAERLMDELGWFATPDTRLGFLSAQAFRAARVVIDIGLHTGRRVPPGWLGAGDTWNFDLAVEHVIRASGEIRASAESEVLRYLSMPAQAISYKLGERFWMEARTRSQLAAGPTFNRKAWHSKMLSLGSVGLDRFMAEVEASGA